MRRISRSITRAGIACLLGLLVSVLGIPNAGAADPGAFVVTDPLPGWTIADSPGSINGPLDLAKLAALYGGDVKALEHVNFD